MTNLLNQFYRLIKRLTPKMVLSPGQRAVVAWDAASWTGFPVEYSQHSGFKPRQSEEDALGVIVLEQTTIPDSYYTLIVMYRPKEEKSALYNDRPKYVLVGSQPSLDGIGRDWFSTELTEPPEAHDTPTTLFERYAQRPDPDREGLLHREDEQYIASYDAGWYGQQATMEATRTISFPTWSATAPNILRGVPLIQVPEDEAIRAP